MRIKNHFSLALLVFCLPLAVQADATREFVKNSSTGDQVEFYWAKPKGDGQFPALLLIHPDQDAPKAGGKAFVENGQLDYWVKRGFVTIAMSQPGYGRSQGAPDFCGPVTQRAARDVIGHFRSIPHLVSKFFMYGGSRGAVVASMISTQDQDLSGVILKSGVYDFVEWAQMRPSNDEIKLAMVEEIGQLTEAKLRERSAFYFANSVKTPLLIIHGTQDSRAPISIAEKFANSVTESGGKVQFIKVDSEHVIPMPKINALMEEFMRAHR